MDCFQFLKHYAPTIPEPHFFSESNCSGMVWKLVDDPINTWTHGRFQLLTNQVMFPQHDESIYWWDYGDGGHYINWDYVTDYNRINKIRSFVIPQYYSVTFTKKLISNKDSIGYLRMDSRHIFEFENILADKTLTVKGQSSFNAGDHPFFLDKWIKYTYYYQHTTSNGSVVNDTGLTAIEYHPNTILQTADSVETLTYRVPTDFTTPYIWKIKTDLVYSILTGISVSCDKTAEQFNYDACILKKPWYIADFPYSPTISDCEEYVTQYCQTKPHDQACACIREEEELNDPALPVVCYGPTCFDKGFVFQRMKDRDCNVNICQQLIKVLGTQNMEITGKHYITCGHQVYTSQEIETINNWAPMQAKTVIDPYLTVTPPQEGGLLNWYIILVVIILFLLIMWVPILIVYFRKQHQIKLMNQP